MHADDMATVFDDRERTDGAPRRNQESTFAFLNRVAGRFWEYPRTLIEQWASHIEDPTAHADVRARLRDKDDRQHLGALHELFVHEMLLRAGYNVTVHPKLARSSRQPDFWVEGNGNGFYVECIVPAWSDLKSASQARFNRFVDGVDKTKSPNFRLSLLRLKVGRTDARASKLRTELERWLRTLDPDTVEDLSAAPTYQWVDDDWSASFSVMPLRPDARGKTGRAIALFAHEPMTSFDGAALIRKGLDVKRSAYGQLEHPFVIALGTDFHDRDHVHSSRAFWGEHFSTAGSFADLGYFGRPGRWTHGDLSGVLLVNRFQPAQLQRTEVTLWVHPGAEHPSPALTIPGDSITFDGNELVSQAGPLDITEFFALPTPWPPMEPWADSPPTSRG